MLERINGPQDIKELNREELEILASEIRRFLIEKISATGGCGADYGHVSDL